MKMLTDDGRTMDARVIGILLAHLGAFGSGELKMNQQQQNYWMRFFGFARRKAVVVS